MSNGRYDISDPAIRIYSGADDDDCLEMLLIDLRAIEQVNRPVVLSITFREDDEGTTEMTVCMDANGGSLPEAVS